MYGPINTCYPEDQHQTPNIYLDEVFFRRGEYHFVRRKYLDAEEAYLAVLGTDQQRFARMEVDRIKKDVLAIEGEVQVRPMMYLAVTYDHRIIDGREAVTFLKRIKECIENPERIMMEI